MLGRLLVVALLSATPLHSMPSKAECLEVSGQMILADSRVDMVFSGRLVNRAYVGASERSTYKATFEVDRVWKGSVGERIDIFVSELAPEAPRFEEGGTYVVVASRVVDAKLRHDIGLEDPKVSAFAARQCSGVLPTDIREQLGEGARPKR